MFNDSTYKVYFSKNQVRPEEVSLLILNQSNWCMNCWMKCNGLCCTVQSRGSNWSFWPLKSMTLGFIFTCDKNRILHAAEHPWFRLLLQCFWVEYRGNLSRQTRELERCDSGTQCSSLWSVNDLANYSFQRSGWLQKNTRKPAE